MNSIPLKTLAAACSLAFAGAALAQTIVGGSTTGITTAAGGGTSAVYLKRTETRFNSFTGSPENTDSLARGLRTGSEITLTGGAETATFTPPTKPMGYGNITRAMDLAQRNLAAAGISNPTPAEIQTAMMGGSISRTDGTVTTTTSFDGVLKLRSEGMGWGQIAHTVGVHPGMGKSAALAPMPTTTTTTTSQSNAVGASVASSGRSGIVTAAGGSSFSANGNGRALGHAGGGGGSSATTAAGASASAGGVTSAKGNGNGNAFGRGK